ncbi:MAG: HD domain-containing protein [Magnetococcales bacterium]|nr:HD domain-containing protein [Magnetococcales bacterium]
MNLEEKIHQLFNSCEVHFCREEMARVRHALDLASVYHEGQVRKLDGSPYLNHPVEVAQSCIDWGLTDSTAICAALLHDALEDAPEDANPLGEIGRLSRDVLELVQALTKIRHLQTGGGDLPATYRRILGAAARDLRVLIIKAMDIYHNSATLEVHGAAKAKVKASLGLIYVGMARRLGIMQFADVLIERLLPHLMPVQHRKIKEALNQFQRQGASSMERLDRRFEELIGSSMAVRHVVEPKSLGDFFVLTERPGTGHLQRIGWPVFRLKVLVKDRDDAFQVLGRVHQFFEPLPRHIRDYLNAPRINGFRALTSRILWEGHAVNVLIVLEEDDEANSLGILAEWGVSGPDPSRYMRLLATLGDSDLRMSEVHSHVLPDLLDIYTPRGDRLTFPQGSVVVDFAYLVHTELGEHCIGAKINGVRSLPEDPLEDGDVVQILTSPEAHPQRSWLEVVKTARAKTLIKQSLKNHVVHIKGMRHHSNGGFTITDLCGVDYVWATCCVAVPSDTIVGRMSEDGHWIVHRADCDKAQGAQWEKGDWECLDEPGVRISVTLAVAHRTGSLLQVLELLAQRGINGQTIQSKGRLGDSFLIELDLGGQDPVSLGRIFKEMVQVPAVQEVRRYAWMR